MISGNSEEWNIFWFKPIGNASAQEALKKAEQKQNVNADGIVNAQVERTLYCFPLCLWPAVQVVKTTFTGTLLKNSLIHPYHPIEKIPDPKLLSPGELPRPETLEKSLEDMFQSDPKEAERFYQSLDTNDRGDVRDLILTEKGTIHKRQDLFFIPENSTPSVKKFLIWFVSRFTPYIPEESINQKP